MAELRRDILSNRSSLPVDDGRQAHGQTVHRHAYGDARAADLERAIWPNHSALVVDDGRQAHINTMQRNGDARTGALC
jgi:hypothetical protein